MPFICLLMTLKFLPQTSLLNFNSTVYWTPSLEYLISVSNFTISKPEPNSCFPHLLPQKNLFLSFSYSIFQLRSSGACGQLPLTTLGTADIWWFLFLMLNAEAQLTSKRSVLQFSIQKWAESWPHLFRWSYWVEVLRVGFSNVSRWRQLIKLPIVSSWYCSALRACSIHCKPQEST